MDARFMDSRIRLVQGDTGPQVQVTLTDETTGDPINLSGATATLHFRSEATGTTLFSRAMTIPVATATQGLATVVWNTGDLDQDPGDYEGEIEVVLATGIRQTVYDTLKFRLREDYA